MAFLKETESSMLKGAAAAETEFLVGFPAESGR
jgi:hypothetical protein